MENMMAQRQYRRAFTLVELLVVIIVLVMVAGMAVPSMTAMMNQAVEMQSHDLLSANIGQAQTLAMSNGSYALVHLELVHSDTFYYWNGNKENRRPDLNPRDQYLGIFELRSIPKDDISDHANKAWPGREGFPASSPRVYADSFKRFIMPSGIAPTKVPGGMCFGEVRRDVYRPDANTGELITSSPHDETIETSNYTAGDLYSSSFFSVTATNPLLDNSIVDFTTFNIVFGPQGNLTQTVNDGMFVRFLEEQPVFDEGDDTNWNQEGNGKGLWNWYVANNNFINSGKTIENEVTTRDNGLGFFFDSETTLSNEWEGEMGARAFTAIRTADLISNSREDLLNQKGYVYTIQNYTGRVSDRK